MERIRRDGGHTLRTWPLRWRDCGSWSSAGEIAAPYATKLLGLLGAEVVKIEPPKGDPLRAWGPFAGDVADRAPRGRAVPLPQHRQAQHRRRPRNSLEGAATVRDLMVSADVVIEHLGRRRARALRDRPRRARVPSTAGRGGAHLRLRPARPLRRHSRAAASSYRRWAAGCRPTASRTRTRCRPAGASTSTRSAIVRGVRGAHGVACGARRRERRSIADLSMLECAIGTLAYPMLLQRGVRAARLPAHRGALLDDPGHRAVRRRMGRHQRAHRPALAGHLRHARRRRVREPPDRS